MPIAWHARCFIDTVMNDFDDEDTQPFTRSVAADDELGLEAADDWFWSDTEAAEARMLDAMP